MSQRRKRKRERTSALRAHGKRRIAERCGILLNHKLLLELVENIQKGRYKFVDRQSQRVTRFQATIEGREMIIVYDRRHKTIVTVLYAEEFFTRRTGAPAERQGA